MVSTNQRALLAALRGFLDPWYSWNDNLTTKDQFLPFLMLSGPTPAGSLAIAIRWRGAFVSLMASLLFPLFLCWRLADRLLRYQNHITESSKLRRISDGAGRSSVFYCKTREHCNDVPQMHTLLPSQTLLVCFCCALSSCGWLTQIVYCISSIGSVSRPFVITVTIDSVTPIYSINFMKASSMTLPIVFDLVVGLVVGHVASD